MLHRPVEAQRGRQGLGQEDAVDGVVRGDLVQQRAERLLIGVLRPPADRGQAVAGEQPLDLAQVRRRGRVFRCFDDREAERRRAASRETGGAPFDVGPDRVGDRASLQELRGQTVAPI
jgi:hypothetical protein